MKYALFLATGYEEGEAIVVADLLRRANINLQLISIEKTLLVTSSHQFNLQADLLLSNFNSEEFDGFILPGGMPGTTNLAANENLKKIFVAANEQKKLIAAICAAPTIFKKWNIITKETPVICYPSFQSELKDYNVVSSQRVVISDNIITGQSLGYVIQFGLALIEYIIGKEMAEAVKKQIAICE